MNIAQVSFSVILYAFFFTYLVWGVYIFNQNPKEKINRIFMVLCFSLAIWSLGYATANVQSYLEQVLFWRRIAAIGWTSLYSLMLHFLLILTRPQGKSPKKYLVFILNIPAAFSMIIYSFSAYFVNMQYSFEEIWYG